MFGLHAASVSYIVPAAGVVEDVLPRRSELQNPPVANVNQVLLVFSLAEPPWDGQVATRFLVSAEASAIPVTVLLNKADLVSEDTQAAVQAQVRQCRLVLVGSGVSLMESGQRKHFLTAQCWRSWILLQSRAMQLPSTSAHARWACAPLCSTS